MPMCRLKYDHNRLRVGAFATLAALLQTPAFRLQIDRLADATTVEDKRNAAAKLKSMVAKRPVRSYRLILLRSAQLAQPFIRLCKQVATFTKCAQTLVTVLKTALFANDSELIHTV